MERFTVSFTTQVKAYRKFKRENLERFKLKMRTQKRGRMQKDTDVKTSTQKGLATLNC